MKVFRFMSKEEFEKYKSGETLKNNTIHQGKTNSIGFCFFDINDYKPEKAMHFLSGIVSFDVCAVFETKKELNKTKGTYAKLPPSTGNACVDFIRVIKGLTNKFEATEYCSIQYNNKDFKLLAYSKNIWEQWKPGESVSQIHWKKIKRRNNGKGLDR